jgi:hypothetical protein
MPTDSNGVYSLPPGYFVTAGQTIEPSQHNPPFEDVASALTARLPRNGSAPMTGNLNMGGNAVRNVADPSLPTDAVNLGTAASGVASPRADVASATTTDIGAATSQYVRITGTTTIAGLGTAAAGVVRDILFDGALTLTHNATSLILPGGANITTAAGDAALFRSEGSGNWRCMRYSRASGAALAGVVGSARNEYRTHTTWTAGFAADDTVPTTAGGVQTNSLTYTMRDAGNSLLISWAGYGAVNGASRMITAALFVGGGANAVHSTRSQLGDVANTVVPIVLSPFLWAPGSTGPHTIAIRVGPNADTMALNGTTATRLGGGTGGAVLTVLEIAG